jgi:ribosomal protein S18 acetylase RimI-like enzyme
VARQARHSGRALRETRQCANPRGEDLIINNYTFEPMLPSVDDYCALRDAVHWWNVSREATERALKNSLFAVCVWHEGQMIGHGRVVGDGSIVFYIQDVIVHPAHQGKGIGTQIMEMIMRYVRSQATTGTYVGLMSAERAVALYEKFGFTKRPDNMPGMGMHIP